MAVTPVHLFVGRNAKLTYCRKPLVDLENLYQATTLDRATLEVLAEAIEMRVISCPECIERLKVRFVDNALER